MKFIVLADNRVGDNTCLNEDGFALYIELDNNTFLFDTGETDLFIKNAEKLNIDLNKVSTVILSHGHHDHANGLKDLTGGKKVILHPGCFCNRYSPRRNMEHAGMNQTEEEITNRFDLIKTKEPYEVCENVYFFWVRYQEKLNLKKYLLKQY